MQSLTSKPWYRNMNIAHFNRQYLLRQERIACFHKNKSIFSPSLCSDLLNQNNLCSEVFGSIFVLCSYTWQILCSVYTHTDQKHLNLSPFFHYNVTGSQSSQNLFSLYPPLPFTTALQAHWQHRYISFLLG